MAIVLRLSDLCNVGYRKSIIFQIITCQTCPSISNEFSHFVLVDSVTQENGRENTCAV